MSWLIIKKESSFAIKYLKQIVRSSGRGFVEYHRIHLPTRATRTKTRTRTTT